MKIESYAGVMARLINGLANQIRANRKKPHISTRQTMV